MDVLGWLGDRFRPTDFVIRYRSGRGVTVRGRIPSSKVGAITGLFQDELRPSGSVLVRGEFGPGRTLRLRVRGALDPQQAQRLRNTLVVLLC